MKLLRVSGRFELLRVDCTSLDHHIQNVVMVVMVVLPHPNSREYQLVTARCSNVDLLHLLILLLISRGVTLL